MLVLSLAVSALVLLVPPALSGKVRLAAAELFEPVTFTARSLLGGLRTRLASFGRGDALRTELDGERRRVQELEARVAGREEELARLRRALAERDELNEMLSRARWRRGVPIPANVIRLPGRWESCEVVIDRGRSSGVEPRCPVLVGGAVLGVVEDVTAETARVLTLGNPRLAIPASVVQNRQQGVVEAEGHRLRLNFVVRDPAAQVEGGQTVVTSGLCGVFPPGCLIGRVGPGVAPAEGKPFYDITLEAPSATGVPEVVWVLVSGPGREAAR